MTTYGALSATAPFDERGLEPPRDVTTLTFREFADIYKQRHVVAKGLAAGKTIDYRLRPLVDRFGDRALTADIEDFIADLKLQGWSIDNRTAFCRQRRSTARSRSCGT